MSLKATNGAYIAAYADGFHDGAGSKDPHRISLLGYDIEKLIEIIGEYEINKSKDKQMTRDEAIEIEKKNLARLPANNAFIEQLAAANIDALIELGLLKVDEPEPTIRLRDNRFTITELDHALFLQNAGYKLVKIT